MSTKLQQTLDVILTVIGTVTGVASTMDSIEQLGRIALLFISILSGILLILVNWDKGVEQIKKWLHGR